MLTSAFPKLSSASLTNKPSVPFVSIETMTKAIPISIMTMANAVSTI